MSPLPDPALKRAQLTIGKDVGELTLQAYKELSTDAVGLGLELLQALRVRHVRLSTKSGSPVIPKFGPPAYQQQYSWKQHQVWPAS